VIPSPPLLVSFTKPHTPDSFAYVDFATPAAKDAAILMTESPLEGRRLLIKDGARISSHSFVRLYERLFKTTAQAAILKVAL
jgi:hypothetical protein